MPSTKPGIRQATPAERRALIASVMPILRPVLDAVPDLYFDPEAPSGRLYFVQRDLLVQRPAGEAVDSASVAQR